MKAGLRYLFGQEIDDTSLEQVIRNSQWQFVRGKSQLALYDPTRNPTGHVLTAWEAWNAYGSDVLDEVIEYSSAKLIATRKALEETLTSRRDQLGLTPAAVAAIAGVDEQEVLAAENNPWDVSILNLERIAFGMGLDERTVFFRSDAHGDMDLATSLRDRQHLPQNDARWISREMAGALAEASSVIRVQDRLQGWLSKPRPEHLFTHSSDYGDNDIHNTRMVGYQLAADARATLNLGDGGPIGSMVELAGESLGIPVVSAKLPPGVASATLSNMDEFGREIRGVVMNSAGPNHDAWSIRVNLARGLGHALFDTPDRLGKVWMDGTLQGPESHLQGNSVDERADAFALAFLAPMETVRGNMSPAIGVQHVEWAMRHFGMNEPAARRRIDSCYSHEFHVPNTETPPTPAREETRAEALDWTGTNRWNARASRRGQFSRIVIDCYGSTLISEDTAKLYLGSSREELTANQETNLRH
jgi:hypothetical protein